jgi:hypothetical protein
MEEPCSFRSIPIAKSSARSRPTRRKNAWFVVIAIAVFIIVATAGLAVGRLLPALDEVEFGIDGRLPGLHAMAADHAIEAVLKGHESLAQDDVVDGTTLRTCLFCHYDAALKSRAGPWFLREHR